MRLVKVNGTGVDVNLFQFDFYAMWQAFFLNPHGHIYARYGMRREKMNQDESLMSLAGLKTVMKRVLEAHPKEADRKPAAPVPRLAETLAKVPETMRTGKACMHCHHILAYGRSELPSFFDRPPNLPPPESLGMTLDKNRGNVVRSVDPAGAAARAGLKEDDELLSAEGTPIYSAADLSWLLYSRRGRQPIKAWILRGKATQEVTLAP